MSAALLRPEVRAGLLLAGRLREAQRPAPPFLDFLGHVYIQPDMDREDYDPEVEFSPLGGVQWQPWGYLVERAEAWAASDSESILKARQLGISWLVAAYVLWRGMFHQYHHVAIFSAGQREARVQLARSRFIWENLPREYRQPVKFRADDAECASGSMLVAFPSQEHTGISYTFRVVVRDEAAFHPYAQANYAAVRPTLSAGGQFIELSTANPRLGPSGDFHDRYWASKRGGTGYRAVFIPWHARPGRDEAWLARERAAYTGLPEEFDAYYPESDAAAFVGRSGLVYPMFDEQFHVADDPCKWEVCKRRVAGIDFGGGDPTVALPLGMTAREHVHQFSEFYERGPVTVEDLYGYLMPWHRRAPFSAVLCDPSEPVAIASLRRLGLPAIAANNDRGEGLGMVAFLLDNVRLSINPACVSSINEFRGYRWRDRTDPHDRQRYATSTPVDHHGDGMDARRYAVMELLSMLSSGPVIGRTASGRKRARWAA